MRYDRRMLAGNIPRRLRQWRVACRRERCGKVELRFSASISDSPFTKAGQPPQPTITSGQAFSEGKHLFGMFVTREDETALADGSSDNMKSTLTVSGSKQAWTHTDKTGMTPISLAANNGENIIIKGYYPVDSGCYRHRRPLRPEQHGPGGLDRPALFIIPYRSSEHNRWYGSCFLEILPRFLLGDDQFVAIVTEQHGESESRKHRKRLCRTGYDCK